ncbi:hypothetical protein [Mycobacterium sp. 1245801.1]|nr:hypothetical protein [Mycobacterium sp. 1245801.1]
MHITAFMLKDSGFRFGVERRAVWRAVGTFMAISFAVEELIHPLTM